MKSSTGKSQTFTQFSSRKYNLVRHVQHLIGRNPLYKVLPVVVHIEPDPGKREITPVGLSLGADVRHDHFRLTTSGLGKLAAGAGISIDPGHSGRRTSREDPRQIQVQSALTVQLPDGQYHTIVRKQQVYLEEARPGSEVSSEERIATAEDAAFGSAMRAFLDLKEFYTLKELEKPFVVPRVCLNTGYLLKDPELKREFLQSRIYEILSSPLTEEAVSEGIDSFFDHRRSERQPAS